MNNEYISVLGQRESIDRILTKAGGVQFIPKNHCGCKTRTSKISNLNELVKII